MNSRQIINAIHEGWSIEKDESPAVNSCCPSVGLILSFEAIEKRRIGRGDDTRRYCYRKRLGRIGQEK